MDYGGVLTTSMGRAFAEFCAENDVRPEIFKDVIAEAYGKGSPDGLVARLELGHAEVEEFEEWLAERLSEGRAETLNPERLTDRLFAKMLPDAEMVSAVEAARRSGVRTALLSNSWGATRYDRERFPDLFDEVIVSGEIGIRKPDPRIFLHAARVLATEPRACVFVDDLLQNVEAARSVGMAAIVHRNAEVTVPKLEELLGVSLRSSDRSPP